MQIDKSKDYDYIAKYWEVLAACAWREYLACGRGALLVCPTSPGEDAIYLPLEKLASNPLVQELARFDNEYDPRQEVVVIFLRPPQSVSAYKGGIPEGGTPPELYERAKPFLSIN